MDNLQPYGLYAPDFELPGIDGAVHHLARYLKNFRAIGVVIMCNHCPYVQAYLERLKRIQTDFYPHGFTLIGINPNDNQRYPEDSFETMALVADQHQLNFPYLRDTTQDVARSFGANQTPEVFLIDSFGIIRYRGAIDDSPQSPSSAGRHYFREAIAHLLNGSALPTEANPAIGCSIKWRH